MVCDVCGKDGARPRRVNRTYGRGDDLVVVQRVPAVTCPHCGESYLTAETLRQLNQIKQAPRDMAVKRSVAVVDFVSRQDMALEGVR